MNKAKIDQKRALPWRILATFALLAAAFYFLGTHWQAVSASSAAIRHADVPFLLLALALMVLTLVIAALTYGVLALHPLRLRETLLIQLAASFVGRLLPAGLGGLGVNGVYLYRRKHSPAEATAVVSVNNLIGMGAHILLLAGVVFLRPETLSSLTSRHHTSIPWLGVLAVVVLLAASLSLPAIRAQLTRFIANLAVSVKKERPSKLLSALALAAALTITYTVLLYVSARAIGVQLSLEQVFIVFSFGMLAGTATPTPGGLVGVEAGLFTGFTLYGAPDTQAGAAILIFRLVSYWLPLIPGVFAVFQARKLRLL